jgi:hypothetical protein
MRDESPEFIEALNDSTSAVWDWWHRLGQDGTGTTCAKILRFVYSPEYMAKDAKLVWLYIRNWYHRLRCVGKAVRKDMSFLLAFCCALPTEDVLVALPLEIIKLLTSYTLEVLFTGYSDMIYFGKGLSNVGQAVLKALPSIIGACLVVEKSIALSNYGKVHLKPSAHARREVKTRLPNPHNVNVFDDDVPSRALGHFVDYTDSVEKKITNNYVLMTVSSGSGEESIIQNAVAVCSDVFMMTGHALETLVSLSLKCPSLIITLRDYSSTYYRRIRFSDAHFVNFSGKEIVDQPPVDDGRTYRDGDCAFMHLPGALTRPYANIVNLFADAETKTSAGTCVTAIIGDSVKKDGEISMRLRAFHTEVKKARNPYSVDTEDAVHLNHQLSSYFYEAYVCSYSSSRKGMCGSLLVRADTSSADKSGIVGILASGNPGSFVSFMPVNRQMVECAIKYLNAVVAVNPGPHPESSMALGYFPEQFVEGPAAERISACNISQIQRTPFYGMYGPADKAPARLCPFEKDGIVIDPVWNVRSKYCVGEEPINLKLWEVATQMYLGTAASQLSRHSDPPRILDIAEAIQGTKGVEPVSKSTAMGYPYNARGITKKMVFGKVGPNDMTTPLAVDLIAKVEEQEVRMRSGEAVVYPYTDFSKDEEISIEKVDLGKVRNISGANVEAVIHGKRAFGWAQNYFSVNNQLVGVGIGMNPYSDDWNLLANEFSDYRLVAGDFGNWDGSYKCYMYYACFVIVSALMGIKSGSSDANYLYSYITNMMWSVHVAVFCFGALFYYWVGGMPSGDFCTLMFNCIGNNVLLRYNFLMSYVEQYGFDHLEWSMNLLPVNPRSLEALVKCITQGDDHIFGVIPEVSWFGFQEMKSNFDKLGFKYTAEDKSSTVSSNLRDILHVSFCKRTFRYDQYLARYVAPLEWISIKNALYYTMSKCTTIDQVIDQMVLEMSLHGKEFFDQKAPKLVRASMETFGHTPIWCTYEQCVECITNSVPIWGTWRF